MGILRSGAAALAGVVCLGIVVTVGRARADSGDWRIGADVRLGGLYGLGSLGSLGAPALGANAGLELGVSARWWLTARLSGALYDGDNSDSRLIGGALGVRFALNPDDDARVSLTALIDGYRAKAEDSTSSSKSQSVGLGLGVTLDLALTPRLDLRFGLGLVRAAIGESSTVVNDITTDDHVSSMSIDMTPSLGLTATF